MKNQNVISIIPVGTKVNLSTDVVGTVESVTIYSENYIVYNCCWWNGRSMNTQPFRSNYISPVSEEKLSIGFRV